jgi:uncharacterized protein (TIGR02453 family)
MSDAGFSGFPAATFDWFEGLERDNSRTYFTATRACYERDVRGALEALLEELAGTFGGVVKLFRQHRDLRFSPDKSPYKIRTYGILTEVPGTAAGLYAQLSSEGLYAGTGYPGLAPDQLERYRARVADPACGAQLEAAVAAAVAAGLEIEGEQLKTAPRGFDRDHPRIDLLRRKALVAGARYPAGEAGIAAAVAREHVARAWRAAQPISAWLEAHVGASELAPRRRGAT